MCYKVQISVLVVHMLPKRGKIINVMLVLDSKSGGGYFLLHHSRFSEAIFRRCSVKKIFLKFCTFHRKKPGPESLFKQSCSEYVRVHKTATSLKKILQQMCFPVNFGKFPRVSYKL